MERKEIWETPSLEELDINQTLSGPTPWPFEIFDSENTPVGGPS